MIATVPVASLDRVLVPAVGLALGQVAAVLALPAGVFELLVAA